MQTLMTYIKCMLGICMYGMYVVCGQCSWAMYVGHVCLGPQYISEWTSVGQQAGPKVGPSIS